MTNFLRRLLPTREPSAQSIRVTLGKLNAKLPSLHEAVRQAAYDLAAEAEGAEDRLRDARTELTAAEQRLTDLALALSVAEGREAEQRAAQEREHRRAVVDQVLVHLQARDAAGARLQTALGEVVASYRAMISAVDEARRSAGAVQLPIEAGGLGLDQIKRMVATETWRQGGDGSIGSAVAFPGARAPTASSVNDPASLPPLVDQLAASTDYVREFLGGDNV